MSDKRKIHIAVDLDGTLAYYDKWQGQYDIVGPPIPKMLANVKRWLAEGHNVSIFTARLSHGDQRSAESVVAIKKFLLEAGLPELPITATKMDYFTHFIDDKAFHVEKNSGVIDGLKELNFID